MKKSLICIGCPRGCRLEVEMEGETITVRGNSCPKGEEYAKQEMTNPRRVVTAVIHTTSRQIPWLPVKTSAPSSPTATFQRTTLSGTCANPAPERAKRKNMLSNKRFITRKNTTYF